MLIKNQMDYTQYLIIVMSKYLGNANQFRIYYNHIPHSVFHIFLHFEVISLQNGVLYCNES